MSIILIEKTVDGVLGIQTRGRNPGAIAAAISA